MRTKSEIVKALTSRLNTSNWKRLVNSLLGKELIHYGAEVISSVEDIKDSLTLSLNPDTTNYSSLITLAKLNDVCVSNIMPSVIRIRITNLQTVTYEPFSLKFIQGRNVFTNIDYVSSDEDITLYQGVVKSAISSSSLSSSDFNNFRFDVNVDYTISNIPSSETSIMSMIKIPGAHPKSVWFFKRSENGNISNIVPFNPLRYGPEYEVYKLRTLNDGTIAVLLGDGIWGKENYDSGDEFQLLWLELTNNEFEAEGKVLYGNTELKNFTVLGSVVGSNDSVEYARATFKEEMLKYATIDSADQIKNFVNSYPYVLDSEVYTQNQSVTLAARSETVESTDSGLMKFLTNVSVYIKPRDPKETSTYGEIEEILRLRGNMFVNYAVLRGTPVYVQFIIEREGLNTVVVESIIKEKFLYEKLLYNDSISVEDVVNLIYKEFGLLKSVRYTVNVDGYTQKLKFIPLQNTVRILDETNATVGWDSNGVIIGRDTDDIAQVSLQQQPAGENFVEIIKSTYPGLSSNISLIGAFNELRGSFDIVSLFPVITHGGLSASEIPGYSVVHSDNEITIFVRVWKFSKDQYSGETETRMDILGVKTKQLPTLRNTGSTVSVLFYGNGSFEELYNSGFPGVTFEGWDQTKYDDSFKGQNFIYDNGLLCWICNHTPEEGIFVAYKYVDANRPVDLGTWNIDSLNFRADFIRKVGVPVGGELPIGLLKEDNTLFVVMSKGMYVIDNYLFEDKSQNNFVFYENSSLNLEGIVKGEKIAFISKNDVNQRHLYCCNSIQLVGSGDSRRIRFINQVYIAADLGNEFIVKPVLMNENDMILYKFESGSLYGTIKIYNYNNPDTLELRENLALSSNDGTYRFVPGDEVGTKVLGEINYSKGVLNLDQPGNFRVAFESVKMLDKESSEFCQLSETPVLWK